MHHADCSPPAPRSCCQGDPAETTGACSGSAHRFSGRFDLCQRRASGYLADPVAFDGHHAVPDLGRMARHPGIRPSLSGQERLGPGHGGLRRLGHDLRHVNHFFHCPAHRRSREFWHCTVPHGNVSALAQATAGNRHRTAGRCAFHRLWHVGTDGVWPRAGQVRTGAAAGDV